MRDADFVVLAVPLGAMKANLEAMRGPLASDAVVTDVGSVKGSVVRDVIEVFGEFPGFFVPGHPIAGTERSGVEAAFPELAPGETQWAVIEEGLAPGDRVIIANFQDLEPGAPVRAAAEAGGVSE